jgi:hypothetical protein
VLGISRLSSIRMFRRCDMTTSRHVLNFYEYHNQAYEGRQTFSMDIAGCTLISQHSGILRLNCESSSELGCLNYG